MSNTDPELLERVEAYVRTYQEVEELCKTLDRHRSFVWSLAEEFDLSSEELGTALDARVNAKLWDGLNSIGAKEGRSHADIIDVVESYVRRAGYLASALVTWIETHRKPSAGEEVYTASDERGHGNDG